MVNGNEILDLLYKPMSDERVLNVMEQLGMEVPLLDEKYELEERVVSESKDGKITFAFNELDGYSKEGMPSLYKIEILESELLSLPFNIGYEDNYKLCCEKFGLEGEQLRVNGRRWKIKYNNNPLLIIIRFSNEYLEGIEFLQIFENLEEE